MLITLAALAVNTTLEAVSQTKKSAVPLAGDVGSVIVDAPVKI
jgi:hypothetical protein